MDVSRLRLSRSFGISANINGDCKTLAPIWETLASDFANEPSVLVAKVDAESPDSKAIAQEHGVTSYPTIKYFPKGSTAPLPYEGARSEKDFVAYINEHAGTRRMPGGALDATAGTIEALDAVVGKFMTEGTGLVGAKEQLQSIMGGLQDKYAEYYGKVLDKIASTPGYVDKELGRLEGLLKKGGLAPEKVDDLISRSNILRKFVKDGGKSEL